MPLLFQANAFSVESCTALVSTVVSLFVVVTAVQSLLKSLFVKSTFKLVTVSPVTSAAITKEEFAIILPTDKIADNTTAKHLFILFILILLMTFYFHELFTYLIFQIMPSSLLFAHEHRCTNNLTVYHAADRNKHNFVFLFSV